MFLLNISLSYHPQHTNYSFISGNKTWAVTLYWCLQYAAREKIFITKQ